MSNFQTSKHPGRVAPNIPGATRQTSARQRPTSTLYFVQNEVCFTLFFVHELYFLTLLFVQENDKIEYEKVGEHVHSKENRFCSFGMGEW